MMRKVLVFFLAIAFCSQSFAATWFVSNSATNGYVVGNDANAGTSKATAVATFAQAHTLASDGDTLQVNCGTYATGTNPANPFTITKGITLQPELAGCATISQANAGDLILEIFPTTAVTITIGSMVLDGTNNGVSCVRLRDNANLYTFVMNGTICNNVTQRPVDGTRPTKINFTMTNATVSQPQNGGFPAIDFHNEVLLQGAFVITNPTITAKNNGVTATSPNALVIDAASTAGTAVTVNMKGGTIVTDAATTSSWGVIDIRDIPNVVLTALNMTTTAAPAYSATGGIDSIHIQSALTGVDSSNPQITNSYIANSAPTSGHGILCGEDSSSTATTAHNHTNNCVLTGNTVVGAPGSTNLHSVMIGNQTGGIANDNTAVNALHCFISKGQTGGTFSRNVGSRCSGDGLRSKASSGITFAVNSIYSVPGQAFTGTSYGMLADDDSVTGIFSSNIRFVGNNLYFSALPTWTDNVGTGSTATFDGNNYFLTSGTQQFSYQGTVYSSVAAWQSAHESNLYFQPSGTVGRVF